MIKGDGRVVRRCWVNFQCQGVLRIWLTVGQGPIVLSVGAGGGCLDIFSLIYHFSFLSPSLWETARYRLKYCLKGPLSPKQQQQQQIMISCTVSIQFIWKIVGQGPSALAVGAVGDLFGHVFPPLSFLFFSLSLGGDGLID